MLVLKTEYNEAWNYFNAKELGDTILGYWREWFDKAEAGQLKLPNKEWPRVTAVTGSLTVRSDLCTQIPTGWGGTVAVPDIRKINILNSRIIVSRKRTRNLFDLTSLWKKMVLTKIDESSMSLKGDTRQAAGAVLPGLSSTVSMVDAERHDTQLAYRVTNRDNIHQRSPSPNKMFFG